jgi:hypothetical protein
MTQQPPAAAAAAAVKRSQPAAVKNAAAAAAAAAADTVSEDGRESDSDVEMVEDPKSSQPPPAATAAGQQQGAKSLPEVLQAEGFVQCQVAGAQCGLDLKGIDNPEHKELWVLRLPDGVSNSQNGFGGLVGGGRCAGPLSSTEGAGQ